MVAKIDRLLATKNCETQEKVAAPDWITNPNQQAHSLVRCDCPQCFAPSLLLVSVFPSPLLVSVTPVVIVVSVGGVVVVQEPGGHGSQPVTESRAENVNVIRRVGRSGRQWSP